ncbi:hypothetical protein GGI00_006013 [Coemansia sp. RSA 2681]|nr:hypothetical protein GGI00_006013 [Coemansia sp. RSA 2681]
MRGELEIYSRQYRNVKFMWVDVDSTPFVMLEYDIPRLPVFKFFERGMDAGYKVECNIYGLDYAMRRLTQQGNSVFTA